MFKKLIVSVALLAIYGCSTPSHLQGDVEYRVGATLWMQNAGEFYALSHQAYNIARLRLDENIRTKKSGSKPLAIVLDLDETVLDNTPYEAWSILEKIPFSATGFDEWVEKKSARDLPGAREFLDYAVSRRIEIFYISNRSIKGLEATYQNMVALNIPIKRENLFLRTGNWGKERRRQDILQKYDITLLMGDNLSDFHEAFDVKSNNERNILVEKFKGDFGKKFIVFPNPLYGDWENIIYGNTPNKSGPDRARNRRQNLYPYR